MDLLTPKTLTTTRGLQYHYFTSPATTTPPKNTLLLLHGFPDSASLYQFLIPALLKTGLRLVIPDLLGHGGTAKPTDPALYAWPLMSADLVEILAEEGVEGGVIPLGHDWGAALSQRFYMLHREKCVALINLNVALMPPSKDPFELAAVNAATEHAIGYPLFAYWELFLDPEGVKLMEQNLEKVWTVMHGDVEGWMRQLFCVRGAMKAFLEDDEAWKRVPLKPYRDGERLKEEWIAQKKAGGLTAPTCWYRATAFNHHPDSERGIDGKVTVPYLFVACDGDAVCRADAIEGAKRLGLVGDCTVENVKAAHWCPFECPEEVGGKIVGWLEGRGFV